MQIDLTEAWAAIGEKFRNSLMNNIFRQRGVDGGVYSPPKPETLKPRKFKSKKVQGVKVKSQKRLWVTGNFAKSAFNYSPDPTGVTVFASENMHPGGAMYKDILKGNSRNYPRSPKHTGPDIRPLVFPRNAAEVAYMRDDVNFARRELTKAITAHLKGIIPEKVEIYVG